MQDAICSQSRQGEVKMEPTKLVAPETVTNTLEALKDLLIRAEQTIQSWNTKTAEAFEQLAASLPKLTLENALEAERLVGDSLRQTIVQLGEIGWCLDLDRMHHGQMKNIDTLLKANDKSALDSIFAAHYSTHLDQIERKLCEAFRSRAHIISDALWAHRQEKFNLSIPVLFTIVDGIAYELTKKLFFKTKSGFPVLAETVNSRSNQDHVNKALMGLLSVANMFSKPYDKEAVNEKEVNRHQVLHGSSVRHGDKINSLKVLSLVAYCHSALTLSEFPVPVPVPAPPKT